MFLSKFVFDNTDDIKVRKLIVNAFVREVILYDDEIVITYNFTDSPEHLKLTKEHVTKTEKEIETADKTAISSNTGSYKLCPTAPSKNRLNTTFSRFFIFLFSTLLLNFSCIFTPKNSRIFARKKLKAVLTALTFRLIILNVFLYPTRLSKFSSFVLHNNTQV